MEDKRRGSLAFDPGSSPPHRLPMLRLDVTERFGVWNSSDAPRPVLLEDDAFMGQVVLGSRRATIQDLVRVAGLMHTVSCDKSALESMAMNVEGAEFVPASQCAVPPTTGPTIPVEACRAVIFAVLCRVLHAQSGVRPRVACFLARLLNANVIPAFSSANNHGVLLCGIISGLDVSCYANQNLQSSRAALAHVGLKSFPLSEREAKLFQSEAFYTLGTACLTAGGATNLTQTIDCIAALSCEANGADISQFDVTYFETIRQQRGQINSANNLRNLLEGSKRLTSSAYSQTFAIIPQVHGPSIETIVSACK